MHRKVTLEQELGGEALQNFEKAKLKLLRPLASLLAPGGKQTRLWILIYHRVLLALDEIIPDVPDATQFRWQMELLARYFNPLPLSEAVRRLREGTLPPRAVSITFDDGYADNREVALPILQNIGVPATFFIATGYLDGGCMWNDKIIETLRRMPDGDLDLTDEGLGRYFLSSLADRLAAIEQIIGKFKYLPHEEREERTQALVQRCQASLPDNLMMTSQQVYQLHQAGMEIGAHTHTHPILASLERGSAEREIAESKSRLEGVLGEPVCLFAYPNGKPGKDYLREHVTIVRDLGFEAAVSTTWGVASKSSHPWQLPRFTPWDASPSRFMARLLWNCRSSDSTIAEGYR